MRRVDITPLEQRKLTFDTHALVLDLEAHGEKHGSLLKENVNSTHNRLPSQDNITVINHYKSSFKYKNLSISGVF